MDLDFDYGVEHQPSRDSIADGRSDSEAISRRAKMAAATYRLRRKEAFEKDASLMVLNRAHTASVVASSAQSSSTGLPSVNDSYHTLWAAGAGTQLRPPDKSVPLESASQSPLSLLLSNPAINIDVATSKPEPPLRTRLQTYWRRRCMKWFNIRTVLTLTNLIALLLMAGVMFTLAAWSRRLQAEDFLVRECTIVNDQFMGTIGSQYNYSVESLAYIQEVIRDTELTSPAQPLALLTSAGDLVPWIKALIQTTFSASDSMDALWVATYDGRWFGYYRRFSGNDVIALGKFNSTLSKSGTVLQSNYEFRDWKDWVADRNPQLLVTRNASQVPGADVVLKNASQIANIWWDGKLSVTAAITNSTEKAVGFLGVDFGPYSRKKFWTMTVITDLQVRIIMVNLSNKVMLQSDTSESSNSSATGGQSVVQGMNLDDAARTDPFVKIVNSTLAQNQQGDVLKYTRILWINNQKWAMITTVFQSQDFSVSTFVSQKPKDYNELAIPLEGIIGAVFVSLLYLCLSVFSALSISRPLERITDRIHHLFFEPDGALSSNDPSSDPNTKALLENQWNAQATGRTLGRIKMVNVVDSRMSLKAGDGVVHPLGADSMEGIDRLIGPRFRKIAQMMSIAPEPGENNGSPTVSSSQVWHRSSRRCCGFPTWRWAERVFCCACSARKKVRRGRNLKNLRGCVELHEVRELDKSFRAMRETIQAFKAFVPLQVVDQIIRGKARDIYVERRCTTIFFSDIQDFTSIAEELPPKRLIVLLEKYLDAMTRIVSLHKGCVSEFIGDAIMGIWNAPDYVDDHQLLACRAALAQQFMVSKLNESFANSDLPLITARMGIHTGYVLAGNIGSPLRMKYGLVGDEVNLASRLEGLNKHYGTRIIVSERTLVDAQESCKCTWRPRNSGESGSLFRESEGNLARESVTGWSTSNGVTHKPLTGIRVAPPAGSQLVTRILGRVIVKGRTKPIAIYELVGETSSLSPKVTERINEFNEIHRTAEVLFGSTRQTSSFGNSSSAISPSPQQQHVGFVTPSQGRRNSKQELSTLAAARRASLHATASIPLNSSMPGDVDQAASAKALANIQKNTSSISECSTDGDAASGKNTNGGQQSPPRDNADSIVEAVDLDPGIVATTERKRTVRVQTPTHVHPKTQSGSPETSTGQVARTSAASKDDGRRPSISSTKRTSRVQRNASFEGSDRHSQADEDTEEEDVDIGSLMELAAHVRRGLDRDGNYEGNAATLIRNASCMIAEDGLVHNTSDSRQQSSASGISADVTSQRSGGVRYPAMLDVAEGSEVPANRSGSAASCESKDRVRQSVSQKGDRSREKVSPNCTDAHSLSLLIRRAERFVEMYPDDKPGQVLLSKLVLGTFGEVTKMTEK